MALSGPLTTHVIKTASGAVKYALPRALPDTRQKRPASHGVLVDLGGAVGSYMPMQYIPEARDITLVDGILDRLAAAGPPQFEDEKLGPTAAELIRRAGLERELARLEAHKELMAKEGLTAKDIEALTGDEKARLLRKYGSPNVLKVIESLRPVVATSSNAPGRLPVGLQGQIVNAAAAHAARVATPAAAVATPAPAVTATTGAASPPSPPSRRPSSGSLLHELVSSLPVAPGAGTPGAARLGAASPPSYASIVSGESHAPRGRPPGSKDSYPRDRRTNAEIAADAERERMSRIADAVLSSGGGSGGGSRGRGRGRGGGGGGGAAGGAGGSWRH